jgi:hypothetical protein
MPDFSMCYYDYCTRPELCQRSSKSGTRAKEHQSWTIYTEAKETKRKATESCTGFYPVDSYEPSE